MTPFIVPDPSVTRHLISLRTSPPPSPIAASLDVPIHDASTRRARLRGLLGHRVPPPFALRLSPCRSIHTFGMRFPLDLHWLDASGQTIRIDHAIPPNRLRTCRRADAVIEVPVTTPT